MEFDIIRIQDDDTIIDICFDSPEHVNINRVYFLNGEEELQYVLIIGTIFDEWDAFMVPHYDELTEYAETVMYIDGEMQGTISGPDKFTCNQISHRANDDDIESFEQLADLLEVDIVSLELTENEIRARFLAFTHADRQTITAVAEKHAE